MAAMKLRVVVVALLVAACASSRPSGEAIDSATDDGTVTDDGATDGTSVPTDGTAPTDGTTPTDGAIDAPPVDGAVVDAAIDAPIDANTCPTQPCDLHVQCGCAPPLTCDIDFTDLMGTSCRAVNVPGTELNTCGSFSECAAGHVCVGGRCHKYCDADNDCTAPRGACAIQITGQASMPIPGATTCSASCNPINSAAGGCPTGQKCGFFTGIGDRDIVDCTAPGTGAIGAACTSDTTCSSNTFCTTYNAQQRCRKVCNRTTGGSECATVAGTTCVGFNPALSIGGTEYGICAP